MVRGEFTNQKAIPCHLLVSFVLLSAGQPNHPVPHAPFTAGFIKPPAPATRMDAVDPFVALTSMAVVSGARCQCQQKNTKGLLKSSQVLGVLY